MAGAVGRRRVWQKLAVVFSELLTEFLSLLLCFVGEGKEQRREAVAARYGEAD
jgi:hypothetical protein